MPELPEVEVVRRGLDDHVVGRRIETARFIGARVARRHLPGPIDLADRLRGNVVQAAQRRGKYLWLVLEAPDGHPQGLVIHLGMSGQLLVEAAGAPRETHLHATFDFADEGPQLRFVDQRTFGGLALAELVPDLYAMDVQVVDHDGPDLGVQDLGVRSLGVVPRTWGIPESITHIAPDPLEAAFEQAAVIARLKARHTAVKRCLLDQGLVSGIGNIYADEALWRARVHGEREAAAMSKPALGRLIEQARNVMLEALGQGGTSFDALYVNVNGASGFFDRSLSAYGREGRPCARCGTLIRREAFMNRSSYSCPRCQPRPRTTR
ncbi:MAG TPA: bifunctional DNA-formamidopyrimidine glycosylase/DNA-(apurinic or apyrimidinic site) lyase [Dermatophilaceae bacterium]|nr:bifunctional DNA-formamidopyrimidine glycosylase/DNA-(apurinic or apyrimidinic site) lyase [Dermatophilaceae bacterium]